jgi:hypothetical protein
MNMATKHTVLQDHLKTWLACKGDRKQRGELLQRLARALHLHEKSVGRSMKRLQMKESYGKEKRGRPLYYTKDVDRALSKVWDVMGCPCAENLWGAITEYVEYFIKENDWGFDDEVTGKLRAMSLGTLKLRVATLRKKQGMVHGRSATVSSPLKGMIPIRKSHTWNGLPQVTYRQTP